MKKIFFALIGLGMMFFASCEKSEVENGTYKGNFNVETQTKFDHKFPHRGREPFEILGEQYTISGKNKQAGGVISTNYGDIPLKFPYVSGLQIRSRIVRDDLGGFDEFFLDGGYVILDFYYNTTLLKEDSVRFDIIAPSEDIEAWGAKNHMR